MIHACPICGWRYGHAPECPLRRVETAETYVWMACIGLVVEFVFLYVLRLPC